MKALWTVALLISLLCGTSAAQTFTFASYDIPLSQSTALNFINNQGAITGVFVDVRGDQHGFLTFGNSYSILDIGLAKRNTMALEAMNDKSDILGNYVDATTNKQVAFLIVRGSLKVLEYPESDFTFSFSLNNSREVHGYWQDSGGDTHGFVYQGGHYNSFDAPESRATFGVGVNNKDVETVQAVSSEDGFVHSYIRHDHGYEPADVAGAVNSYIRNINDRGEAVYTWTDTNGAFHGAYRAKGKVTTFDFPRATGTFANGINNQGVIVGTYTDSQNVRHGFIAAAQ